VENRAGKGVCVTPTKSQRTRLSGALELVGQLAQGCYVVYLDGADLSLGNSTFMCRMRICMGLMPWTRMKSR